MRAQLADADLARDLIAATTPASGSAAYQFTCWPPGGLAALHQALAVIPALSVTTTVTMARADNGQVSLSATTSMATGRRLSRQQLDQAVASAAAPFGSCLAPRQSRVSGWFSRTGGSTLGAARTDVIPIASGGVVLGTAADGELLAVPLFTERGVRAAALGDARLPKLLALRALGTGARVRVVTSGPAAWLALRDEARLPGERMAVVGPGAPVPTDGTRTAPLMIIDDTGSPAAAAVARPWQAFVAAPDPDDVTIAALRGLDSIILHRSTPVCRAAAIVAMDLPTPVTRSLHGIPRDVIAVARPGTVGLAPLTTAAPEQALLGAPGPSWPGSPLLSELGSSICRSNDRLAAPELTGAVSVGSRNGGAAREDA